MAAPVDSSAELSQRMRVATRIAELIDPPSATGELGAWRAGQQAVMMRQPGMAQLEAKCPEIIEVAIDAAQPVALNHLRAMVSSANARKARILADALTVSELKDVLDFSLSSTGQRFFVGAKLGAPDPKLVAAHADRVLRTGSTALTSAEVAQAGKSAAQNGLQQLSDHQRRDFERFRASATGKKYEAMQPALTSATMDVAKDGQPDWNREQGAAMQAAMLDHIHHNCRRVLPAPVK